MNEGEHQSGLEMLLDFSNTHRIWVLPILRTLDELGGEASPRDVVGHIRRTVAAGLNPLQWARILNGKHIRWARVTMKEKGLIAGEHGKWALTEGAKAFLSELAAVPTAIPDDLPELSPEEAGNVTAELTTMQATNYDGYHVPILKVLAERGVTSKSDLVQAVGEELQGQLLPGDRGTMPAGDVLWRYRVSWALTNMKKAGDLRNVPGSSWEITEAGKARLQTEGAGWSIQSYQGSKAKVRPPLGFTPPPDAIQVFPPPPATEQQVQSALDRWRAVRPHLGERIFRALDLRLRPDLGASPTLSTGSLGRNVILYGPPGTGKTFLAKRAAMALTGESDPGDDTRWQVVQFHPSYAYEDFIQGLRPDLEHRDLRYALSKGPFLQICERASDEPDEFFVLVIDEINRGDPARIFGELLYGLEYRNQPVSLPTGGDLRVPANLAIIGTMNSVDRSVALVDYALRRRFAFVRVDPDAQVVLAARGDSAFGFAASRTLDGFNQWIVQRLGREHALGHSIFLNPALPPDAKTALELIWELDVQPLLEEYFFGEGTALRDAAIEWKRVMGEALTSADEETAGEELESET